MLQHQSENPRLLRGSITIWMIFLLPILLGLFAFSLDFGMVFYEKSKTQTAADSAALAGVDVLKRVLRLKTTDMPAICKAGYVGEAVMEAATAAQIAPEDVQIVYCPRSSEVNICGGGPCCNIPTDAACDADCNCGGLSGSITSAAKPWDALFPLDAEMAGSGTSQEDSAGYVYVEITRGAAGFFAGILSAWPGPEVKARAIAIAKKVPIGAGYYQPLKAGNDPQTINLKDGSRFVINNGGILIMDDPNNALTSSGSGNSVSADWIKVVIDEGPNNITFTCDVGPCPEYNADVDDIEAEPPQFNAQNCSSLIITDATEKCTRNETLRIYANCTIDSTNKDDVNLYPGTYCGGLTIDGVNVVLSPLVAGGVVVEDVYYFVERSKQPGDVAGTPPNAAGKLLIKNNSTVQAVDGGVTNAGVFIYAPEVGGSDFGIDISTDSTLQGLINIWSDHIRLDDSLLSFSIYSEGKSRLNVTKMNFSLVQ